MRSLSSSVYLVLLAASGVMTLVFISLAFVQRVPVRNSIGSTTVDMPATAWLYICASVVSAHVGVAAWKYGFPYQYLKAGSWWATLIVGALVILFANVLPDYGNLGDWIIYTMITGLGVITLAQGVLELINRVHRVEQ